MTYFDVSASTSLRTRPPAQTLGFARDLSRRLGVTSVVDATGEDVLGVPVWFSERPSGIVSTLHAGKGIVAIDAEVGAEMEAIEYAVAEADAAKSSPKVLPLGDIGSQFDPPLSIAQFAPIVHSPATPDRAVRVVECEDVSTGLRYRLPSELVDVPAAPPDDGAWVFGWSSNGLASGNSVDEATLHALLEVLERDCVALDHVQPSPEWIDTESLPMPMAEWAHRWTQLGVELHVRHIANGFLLPCFEACIVAPESIPPRRAYGWGLHPNPCIAVARAVTEAAQSRLHVLRNPAASGHHRVADVPFHGRDSGQRIDFARYSVAGMTCESVGETLVGVLELMRRGGLPWVLRRRIPIACDGAEVSGLSVVKVIVPGCESAIGKQLRIGRRLLHRLINAA